MPALATRAAPGARSNLRRMAAVLRLWRARVRARREMRRAAEALDERAMRDIGLARAELREPGLRPFWRDDRRH